MQPHPHTGTCPMMHKIKLRLNQSQYGLAAVVFLSIFILSSLPAEALPPASRRVIDSGIRNYSPVEVCQTTNTPAPVVPQTTAGTALAEAEQVGAYSGPQIEPSAIILHWTAGEYATPQDLVGTLNSRDRSVQLTVDKEGKVYQLAQTLETRPVQSMEDQGWNDVSIGIEIESGSFGETDYDAYENDLLGNDVQFQKVVAVVKDLMAKYNIPNEVNTAEKRGIFGHLEANATSKDPGPNYIKKVRDTIGQNGQTPTTPTDNTVGVSSSSCVCDASSLVGSGGAGSPEVPKDFTLGPLENGEARRVNLIKALMADFGLTPEQAAGPVGNFMAESGGTHLPPDINQGIIRSLPPNLSDGGYGWAQWSYTRHRQFADFGVEKGYVPSKDVPYTDAANYAFLKFELTTGYTVTIDELKKVSTPEDAALSFEDTFEKAGVVKPGLRSGNARQAFEEYKKASGGTGPATSGGSCGSAGNAAILGENAFPLIATKSILTGPLGNAGWLFAKPNETQGGHDYSPHVHDIYAPPGTPVVAFLSGTVSRIGEDKCPGRSISVYNEANDLVVWYAHLQFNEVVKVGDTVVPGQKLGEVGPPNAGCGTPHLHIDASKGKERGGCKRGSCPQSVRDKFVKIGDKLYALYQLLPQ
ncbi:hypothetical protein E6P97_03805 [Patescibacteria group bacterium]|nr:MAG: hypothetical protein E6P97_03805 [Patescibacteria group bacterium]